MEWEVRDDPPTLVRGHFLLRVGWLDFDMRARDGC
jgi:hypothetical protein